MEKNIYLEFVEIQALILIVSVTLFVTIVYFAYCTWKEFRDLLFELNLVQDNLAEVKMDVQFLKRTKKQHRRFKKLGKIKPSTH